MDVALPEEALRPSRPNLEKKLAWHAFVKSAETIFEMVQTIIMLKDMIKIEYLMNGWWYWSSLSAAAKTSIVSSLALCVYSLDAAIVYEKISFNLDDWQSLASTTSNILNFSSVVAFKRSLFDTGSDPTSESVVKPLLREK